MEAMVFVVAGLVTTGFGAYIALMIYFPEWVGITGKAAHKTIDEHKEGSQVDDSDPFSSHQKR